MVAMASRIARDPRCAGRVIDGRAALVTPHDNRLHLLNPTATTIWRRTERACTVADLVVAITDEFEVVTEVAEKDVAGFVADLIARGILRVEQAP